MAKLEIHRVPVLRDNYVWLAHEASSNLTAAVDPAVVDPVLAALDVQVWSLTHILNTHHHHDHTGQQEPRPDHDLVATRQVGSSTQTMLLKNGMTMV